MIKKYLSTATTFIGALIGAGFASGREIALYFEGYNIFVPLLSGIFLGLFCYLFLRIGSFTKGNPLSLFGKSGFVFDGLITVSNLITLCAMTAGSELTFFYIFGIHGGGIITILLTLFTVLMGVEKLKISNFLIVPIIIVLIIYLLFRSNSEIPILGKFNVYPAFSYCTMNIVGGGFLISTLSSDFNKKDCIITASISGIFITILILAVFCTVQNYLSFDMPLMESASYCKLWLVGNIAMYLSIFTTMTSNLSIVSKNKIMPAIFTASVALAVSVFGFRTLVDKIYPFLGIAGGIIAILFLFLYIKKTKTAFCLKTKDGKSKLDNRYYL